jgi:hypothetical protein
MVHVYGAAAGNAVQAQNREFSRYVFQITMYANAGVARQ